MAPAVRLCPAGVHLLTARVALPCALFLCAVTVSTTILGERVSSPIAIAPTAMQRMAHPEGETATARGESDFDATEQRVCTLGAKDAARRSALTVSSAVFV